MSWLKAAQKIPGWGRIAWAWEHRKIIALALIAIGTLFLYWRLQVVKQQNLQLENANATLAKTVENQARAIVSLEERSLYEKENSNVAAESAAAVAAGRKNGDAPMAPVLRNEYERVRNLARQRYPR